MITTGLSPYATEFTKLAEESCGTALRYIRHSAQKTRKGRRPIRASNLVKKALQLPKVSPAGAAAGASLGTIPAVLTAQGAHRDWKTGRQYRKAMEAQRREAEKRQREQQ